MLARFFDAGHVHGLQKKIAGKGPEFLGLVPMTKGKKGSWLRPLSWVKCKPIGAEGKLVQRDVSGWAGHLIDCFGVLLPNLLDSPSAGVRPLGSNRVNARYIGCDHPATSCKLAQQLAMRKTSSWGTSHTHQPTGASPVREASFR